MNSTEWHPVSSLKNIIYLEMRMKRHSLTFIWDQVNLWTCNCWIMRFYCIRGWWKNSWRSCSCKRTVLRKERLCPNSTESVCNSIGWYIYMYIKSGGKEKRFLNIRTWFSNSENTSKYLNDNTGNEVAITMRDDNLGMQTQTCICERHLFVWYEWMSSRYMVWWWWLIHILSD